MRSTDWIHWVNRDRKEQETGGGGEGGAGPQRRGVNIVEIRREERRPSLSEGAHSFRPMGKPFLVVVVVYLSADANSVRRKCLH